MDVAGRMDECEESPLFKIGRMTKVGLAWEEGR